MRTASLILTGILIGVLIALPFRSRHDASSPQLATGDTPAERELDRVVAAVDIDGMPFDRAVEEIQKLTTAPIAVDWTTLKNAGFDRHTLVTIHGTGIYLWQVLERLTGIASQATGKGDPVSYQPRDGRIAISIARELGLRATAQLYEVRDLVFEAPATAPAPGWMGRTGPIRMTSIEGLKRLIEDNVASSSWIDYGGNVGTIFETADRLYIVQDRPAHREIEQLLRDLRAIGATQPPRVLNKDWSDAHQTWITPDVPEKLEALIRRPIDRVDFDGVPFDQAIERLQKLTGVTISVDWKALADANVSRTAMVSVLARGVALPAVLDLLFAKPINGTPVGYGVEDGVVEISIREEAAKYVIMRLYDVRDFANQAKPSDQQETMEKLMKLIVDTVAPDSWRDSGGTIGSMREFKSRLVVTQTWYNHELIAAELDAIRKSGRGLAPATQPGVPLR